MFSARSTASEMAVPSDPVESGCSLSILRPMAVVSDGEGMTLALNVSMMLRRKGFCS